MMILHKTSSTGTIGRDELAVKSTLSRLEDGENFWKKRCATQPSSYGRRGAPLQQVGSSRDKERKCSELVEGLRCKLVVVAIETGGRWSVESCKIC